MICELHGNKPASLIVCMLCCRGTDHLSFEIPADQLPQTGPDQSPNPVTHHPNQVPPKPPGDPLTPGPALTPSGHLSSHSISHTPVQPMSADSAAVHQQQLSQLQQMAADAGLLLVPGSQSMTPASSHSRFSPHGQHLTPQGQLQQQQGQLFSAYPISSPQQAVGPHPIPAYNSMLASTSGWQNSPGLHAQQQSASGQSNHRLFASTAHWQVSPSMHSPQAHQLEQVQPDMPADPLLWQATAGLHAQQQQQSLQSRLPGWAQQALQQPLSNSPGSCSFAGHLSGLNASFAGNDLQAMAMQQQSQQQLQGQSPAGNPWLQHVPHQPDDYSGDMSLALNAVHAMQPRLSQAWEIPAHSQSQQMQGAAIHWSAAQQSDALGQRQVTAEGRPVGQGPAQHPGLFPSQDDPDGSDKGQAASNWQHAHAGQSCLYVHVDQGFRKTQMSEVHTDYHACMLCMLDIKIAISLFRQYTTHSLCAL